MRGAVRIALLLAVERQEARRKLGGNPSTARPPFLAGENEEEAPLICVLDLHARFFSTCHALWGNERVDERVSSLPHLHESQNMDKS